MRWRSVLLCGVLLGGWGAVGGLLSGCSSVVNAHRQKEPMMAAYLAGNRDPVAETLDDKLQEPGWFNSSAVDSGDEIMWRLEAGAFHFLTARDERSIAHLKRAEELMADFDRRAVINLRQVGAESAMLVTNLNALPYRGWCRDRVMLPLFKAFAYLGKNDEEGFRVELFRLRETQDRVMADYQKFFEAEDRALKASRSENAMAAGGADAGKVLADSRNRELSAKLENAKKIAHRGYGGFLNPFAIFMSGYGYARDGDFQNAVVDYERLYRAMPDHPPVRRYYVTALKLAGREIPKELAATEPLDFPIGRRSVLVVFANGRSAAFRQVSLYIPVIFPGYATVAAVAWPVCEYYRAPYRSLQVAAAGRTYHTETVADMDGILSQEYTERLPGMIARIVFSTAVKEVGSYFATRAAAEADPLAGVAVALGTSAYKIAFNTADTRTWEMLPREFQVVQFPMPENRRLVLAPDGASPRTVELPAAAESAIVYVNAPSGAPAAFDCRVLGLGSQEGVSK